MTAEEVDEACEEYYDPCIVEVKFEMQQKDSEENKTHPVTVFAGYTDHPMLLFDGVSHTGHIKNEKEVKYFKYPLHLMKPVLVSLRKSYSESYELYAKLTTIHEKFIYPSENDYLEYLKDKKD